LNAVTTGAHILDGKIYQNRMIDLNISNTKLFYRTIEILKDIVGVDKDTAFMSILKSIYRTDELTEEQIKAPISQHVNAGTWKKKNVPRALLIATGKFNFEQAEKALAKEPVVRAIIEKIAKE
jgi:N-acetylmuramic acid 6-phosphate (MurNAc-6-P) etherase